MQLIEPDASTPSDSLDPIVATAKAAGDPLRAGVLRVLRDESFSVGELCAIFEIAQPAMSHHLKVLSQAALVTRRREGNTMFYRRLMPAQADGANEILRNTLFQSLDQAPLTEAWADHIAAIHRARKTMSERFFQANADKFDDQQARICSAGVYAPTVREIIQASVADKRSLLEVGPGDGELLESLSPHFHDVTAIDNSASMLERTRQACLALDNIKLLAKPFDALPRIRKYNAVVAAMVVHHLPSPQQFFQQAQWVIKKNGVLVVVELCSHDQQWVHDACGDLWLGFEEADLNAWAARTRFAHQSTQHLAQTNGFRVQIICYQSTQ